MQTDRRSLALGLLLLTAACSSDDNNGPDSSTPSEVDAGSADASASEQPAQLTYWQDMAPLFAQHCLQCHREGGIAPFRLDDYASAKPFALAIAHATSERTMPPWAVTSDGSCGNFADSLALTDAEIARVNAWAKSGAPEGTRKAIEIPALPSLQDATEVSTPEFVPVAQGGKLTENDEYRCFPVEIPADASGYVTGYEVLPGTAEIVHHVAAFIVDPEAKATGDDGKPLEISNRERMKALQAETPDRAGWPCFNAAGDGVEIDASFVVWAPGQGVVNYPKGTGIPIDPKQQLVIQVHYNLSDTAHRGSSDQTRLRLRVEKDVEEVGIFVLEDPFLTSMYQDEPSTLPPRKSSTIYSWKRSGKQMDMTEGTTAKLYGVMPHMHGLGRKYQMTITPDGEASQCAAQIDNWNFHWQRLYFYEQPYTITPDTQFAVSCDYDTSSVNAPVEPGWGTSNEMCLATLFLTVDKDTYRQMKQ